MFCLVRVSLWAASGLLLGWWMGGFVHVTSTREGSPAKLEEPQPTKGRVGWGSGSLRGRKQKTPSENLAVVHLVEYRPFGFDQFRFEVHDVVMFSTN